MSIIPYNQDASRLPKEKITRCNEAATMKARLNRVFKLKAFLTGPIMLSGFSVPNENLFGSLVITCHSMKVLSRHDMSTVHNIQYVAESSI